MLCAERPKPQKTGSAWMHLATLYRKRSLVAIERELTVLRVRGAGYLVKVLAHGTGSAQAAADYLMRETGQPGRSPG